LTCGVTQRKGGSEAVAGSKGAIKKVCDGRRRRTGRAGRWFEGHVCFEVCFQLQVRAQVDEQRSFDAVAGSTKSHRRAAGAGGKPEQGC